MAAIINVSGSAQDIIAFARTLETGLAGEARGLVREEREALDNDEPLTAIKLVRERLGFGLKDAKDFVEATPEFRRYVLRRDAKG